VKIDNGVHIGHNAHIGRESILTAHCVIGGSAKLGKRVWVGLGAQIKNQITVGDDAVIGMGAIVVKDVPAGVTVVGNPAKELEK
jgi:UDP-3-O-[3-hydroxymyristoyl] glucosamine N-acyltransferase